LFVFQFSHFSKFEREREKERICIICTKEQRNKDEQIQQKKKKRKTPHKIIMIIIIIMVEYFVVYDEFRQRAVDVLQAIEPLTFQPHDALIPEVSYPYLSNSHQAKS